MTFEDLTLVWRWRNDPKVRKSAEDDKYIEWDEHLSWFKNNYGLQWIFTINHRSVGVITKNKFDYWSFYLDPGEIKRQGYGLIMLSLMIAECKQNGVKEIKAKVQPENKASLQLHSQVGFKLNRKMFYGKKPQFYEFIYTINC